MQIAGAAPVSGPQRLRLLSFNIQAGTSTPSYRHYVTHSWRQVLPHSQRTANLDSIASLVSDYDMVALQEVDSGSLRSGFINQSRYLANHAGMPFWCHQRNRKVGNVAYAGNGFLSRYEPRSIEEFRLPGPIPGRGSLVLTYGENEAALWVAVVHLALGKRARRQQLQFLTERLQDAQRLIVMGDFNTSINGGDVLSFCDRLGLQAPTSGLATYPSWQPQRDIDHILLSQGIDGYDARVVDVGMSDHCPIELSVQLPEGMRLRQAVRPTLSVQTEF